MRALFPLSVALTLSLSLATGAHSKPQKSAPTAPKFAQLLGAISAATNKPVFWLGAPPTAQMVAMASQPSPDGIETLGEWAARWAGAQNVVMEASPDALLFRRAEALQDPSGATTTSQFIVSERLQLALMESLPPAFLARTPAWETSHLAQGGGADAASETIPLLLLSGAKPSFERGLRAWLKIFHTRAQGQRTLYGETFSYNLALEEVPVERLRLSFTAHTDALCRVGNTKVLLRLPPSQPCLPDGCSLAQNAAPVLQRGRKGDDNGQIRVIQSDLRAFLAAQKTASSRLIVARNLQRVPLTIAAPRGVESHNLSRTLEKTLGLARRQVADLEHLTVAADAYTQRAHALVSRWQMARGVAPYSYFTAQINRPGWAKVRELDWPARWAIVTQFRQWQSQNPEAARAFSERELRQRGEVWLAHATTLHLLLVEPATDKRPLVPLEHFPITLHASSPPA